METHEEKLFYTYIPLGSRFNICNLSGCGKPAAAKEKELYFCKEHCHYSEEVKRKDELDLGKV